MKLKLEFVVRDLPGDTPQQRQEVQQRVWEAISEKRFTISLESRLGLWNSSAVEYVLSPYDYTEMVEND